MYCSRACQSFDWSGLSGQSHKQWCGLPCGEEDVDWEIRFINLKRGYGLVALRNFEPEERVFVERLFSLKEIESLPTKTLASFLELAPLETSSTSSSVKESCENKFYLNCISIRDSDEPALGLRLSRINHACVPNTDWWDDKNNLILITRTRVTKGQEFTFSYTNAMDPVIDGWTTEKARALLANKWDIVCEPDCLCHNMAIVLQIQRARELDADIINKIRSNLSKEAFLISETLLQLHFDINSSKLQQLTVMYNSFCLGITSESTEHKALVILRELRALSNKLFGPCAESTIAYDKLLECPQTHPNHYRRYL
jgi:hypothetical protein